MFIYCFICMIIITGFMAQRNSIFVTFVQGGWVSLDGHFDIILSFRG